MPPIILLILVLAGGDAFPENDTRSIDFFNYTYLVDDQRVSVIDGAWSGRVKNLGSSYVEVTDVWDGDLTGDGLAESAVLLSSHWGGTGFYNSLQVFTAGEGTPALIAELPGGDRDRGSITDVAIENRLLKIVRSASDCYRCSLVPAECACRYELRTYRWKHDALVLVSTRPYTGRRVAS